MKKINKYILEKLHISKGMKMSPKYIKDTPVLDVTITNYQNSLWRSHLNITNIYVIDDINKDEIKLTSYLDSNSIVRNGEINSHGIFEIPSDNTLSILLLADKVEEFYLNLDKYKFNLEKFPYEKYFDEEINKKSKENMSLTSLSSVNEYYKRFNNLINEKDK